MTVAINAHVGRHDTYGSRFSLTDDGAIARHVVTDRALLEFQPQELGAMSWQAWRYCLLETPGPFEWDCFRFQVIAYADHFTVCACIDHLHCDGSLMAPVFADIHDAYTALVAGSLAPEMPAPSSYLEYCENQATSLGALTRESTVVREWREFLEQPDPGPCTALPLGAAGGEAACVLETHHLMDADRAGDFERSALAAKARFIGAILAVTGIAWTQLAQSTTFRAVVPTATRKLFDEGSPLGWLTGVVPVSFSTTGASLPTIARAAQDSFDSKRHLESVPPDVLQEFEWDESLPIPDNWSIPMVSLIDYTRPPFNSDVITRWREHGGRLILNEGAASQVGIWAMRDSDGVRLTLSYPDTLTARQTMGDLVLRMSHICEEFAGVSTT